MFRPEATSRSRRAFSALAFATVLAVAALARGPLRRGRPSPDAPGAELGSLEPLAPVAEPALRRRVEALQPLVAAGEPTIERVGELAEEVVRSTRPQFPIQGDFNWGQSGAQFGAGRSGSHPRGPGRVRAHRHAAGGRPRGQGRRDRQRRRPRQLRGHPLGRGRPDLRLPAHERARAVSPSASVSEPGQTSGRGGLHRIVLRHAPALRGPRRQGHPGRAHRSGASAGALGAELGVAPGPAPGTN